MTLNRFFGKKETKISISPAKNEQKNLVTFGPFTFVGHYKMKTNARQYLYAFHKKGGQNNYWDSPGGRYRHELLVLNLKKKHFSISFHS